MGLDGLLYIYKSMSQNLRQKNERMAERNGLRSLVDIKSGFVDGKNFYGVQALRTQDMG